ncbi:hypothetical protein Ga0466249_003433 [Sporomusaceae bacterium BoRhaA]|nr:hypothetical protein [Pelorhabdus rhamnosifermentans]
MTWGSIEEQVIVLTCTRQVEAVRKLGAFCPDF